MVMTRESEEYLTCKFPHDEIRFIADREVQEADLDWAQVVLGNITLVDRLLAREGILWLHSPNAGLDMYTTLTGRRPGIHITNSQGVMDHAVAEHTLAMLLALSRGLPMLLAAQSRREWARGAYMNPAAATVIAGKRAHVLGYGRIAQAIVSRLSVLSLRVTVYRRQPSGSAPDVERFLALSSLVDNVAQADVVIAILPDYPSTRGIISGAVLARLKPTALLINVGRGSAIDLGALVAAIQQNGLAGVALDVFPTEPLPQESPLWSLPNVLLSPHVAGRFGREIYGHIDEFYRLSLTARVVQALTPQPSAGLRR
jgi:phosphoglycerate dehydrogenase-like enzyme